MNVMVFPIFDTQQAVSKLLETRHELVSYLHKCDKDTNFDKNTKWQEMVKQIGKIDELILSMSHGKH